jgi:hypothetical protein
MAHEKTTRRFRKQSGENPKRGQSDHLVGETIRKGIKSWNDKKIAQQRERYGPNIWEEGFSKGIDKIVEFGKKHMDGYYNFTKYPGKAHWSDELKK